MAGANVAHKINSKKRTQDVLMSENVDFAGLLLSEPVQRGLLAAGFEKPSPIQLKAIPLGRCGLDLIVQAKSGTGKTCVFSVIALENIQITSSALQVLVLAPTREIAVQIQDVIKNIGACLPRLACHTFIGGLPIKEDIQKLKRCQIAIGSPGRVKHLIEHGLMSTESIRIFILDEADKLLEDSFQEQINWIYSTLPDNKQILALSATYPEYLAQHLTAYMRNPTFIRLNISDPALLGIKQYYSKVKYHPLPNKQLDIKTASVISLLSNIVFKQCLIFSNLQTRAQNLCSDLQSKGWPTSCIAGSLDQKERLQAMDQLKTYKCRVLISTDLTSRGIDADKVDLVINLDVPFDHETYLHRIGRAGRFGSFGAAVSIVSEGKEEQELWAVERKCHTKIHPLPDPIPNDLVKIEVDIDLEGVISVEEIVTRNSETMENCDIISDKVSKAISPDPESKPTDLNKDNNQTRTDNLGEVKKEKVDDGNDTSSNGHIDNIASEDSEKTPSAATSTCFKTSSQNDLNRSDTSDSQSGNISKTSQQILDTSQDLLMSNSSQKPEENLTENRGVGSEIYPSKQKYVFHDEHSFNKPANHQGNKISKNSKTSSDSKTLKQKYSKTNGDVPQETENNSKLFSEDLKSEMNVNQSNSSDANLTKTESLESPVVDVQDFLTSSVSFSKPKKSPSDKPDAEAIVPHNPDSVINPPSNEAPGILMNQGDTSSDLKALDIFAEKHIKVINASSKEKPARVTKSCDLSLNTFEEKHSKLKAKLDKLEQETVVKDSKSDLIKCCSDLVKSIQTLNIGQISSQNEDISTSSDTTVDLGPKVLEKSADASNIVPGPAASKFLDSNFNTYNANITLSAGVESTGNVITENSKDANLSKISSTKRKGRTYEDILKSFNEFQSSNIELKPCDYVSRIKQDLQNAAQNSYVDENLKMAVKNLDKIYSDAVKSKNKDTKSVSVQTEPVNSAESLLSVGTQTQIPRLTTSKLTNRMAVSALTEFSTNQSYAQSGPQDNSEFPSATKFPMCQSDEETKIENNNQHGLDCDEAITQGNQQKSENSTKLKNKGGQIQYGLQDMAQKIRTGEMKFGASFDSDEDTSRPKILVANQNGVVSLSDVEELSACSSSNSNQSSSEISDTSDSSSASINRKKNKMEAVARDRVGKPECKTKGERLNKNRDKSNKQNAHPEVPKRRNKKTKKHSTCRSHESHYRPDRESQKSRVTDENGYDKISQAPAYSEQYKQWYKQYYEQNQGLSYTDQARDAYPDWHEQDQTKCRQHQDFDPEHAYSEQNQKYYDQPKSRKHHNLDAEHAYSESFQQYYNQPKSRKNQAKFDADQAYSDWCQQWNQWYMNWYTYNNPNPYYQYMPPSHFPYSYPYSYGGYSGMPYQAAPPPKSAEESLKDSVRFAKIQKEYIKQMSK